LTRSKTFCYCSRYEKNYHCPNCSSINTIKKGKRRGRIRFKCKDCDKWFQINRTHRKVKDLQLVIAHLDGLSFRALGDQYNLHASTVYRRVRKVLERLPHCADVSRKYCSKYCGIHQVDGKFIKVKGYDRKIPVIYGIDYQTHDIPTYKLARSENYQACLRYFSSLKLINYPLLALIADDNSNIRQACEYIYPNSAFQLCQRHYKQNIKLLLNLSENPHYQPFFDKIIQLFAMKRSEDDFNRFAKNIFNKFKEDRLCVEIMVDIYKKRSLLLGWRGLRKVPLTTNLIESFNSHLQARLKSIKGFENFHHADLWLNAYFLRRRTKKFTDCRGKFRNLNGKTSLQKSKKPWIDIPSLF
jgi:transposase-like protein